MSMRNDNDRYIAALKFGWLTPFCHPLLRWTLRESTFKRQLVREADIQKSYRVLDLGCGTATLTLLIKQTNSEAEVLGLDGDQDILTIACAKASETSLGIALVQGLAYDLPFPDNSFDRVLSSLLFHHLTRQNKARTLRKVFRVLRPGGELHVADWGKPANVLMRGAFLLVQMLDGFENTSDSVQGLLPRLVLDVGFREMRKPASFNTIFGTVRLYSAGKPA